MNTNNTVAFRSVISGAEPSSKSIKKTAFSNVKIINYMTKDTTIVLSKDIKDREVITNEIHDKFKTKSVIDRYSLGKKIKRFNRYLNKVENYNASNLFKSLLINHRFIKVDVDFKRYYETLTHRNKKFSISYFHEDTIINPSEQLPIKIHFRSFFEHLSEINKQLIHLFDEHSLTETSKIYTNLCDFNFKGINFKDIIEGYGGINSFTLVDELLDSIKSTDEHYVMYASTLLLSLCSSYILSVNKVLSINKIVNKINYIESLEVLFPT